MDGAKRAYIYADEAFNKAKQLHDFVERNCGIVYFEKIGNVSTAVSLGKVSVTESAVALAVFDSGTLTVSVDGEHVASGSSPLMFSLKKGGEVVVSGSANNVKIVLWGGVKKR